MKLNEVFENRRSIRNFKQKAVSEDIIESIINDAILAPNAGNEQPWKFIVINNKQMIERISSESKKNILERINSNPDDYAKKYEEMLRKEGFNIYYNAPTVILIFGNAGLKNLHVDCALAASYLMLSATSKGLGSCWVNFGAEILNQELRKEIGLEKNHKIVAPVALGYPHKIPDIPKRKRAEIIKNIN